MRHLGLFLAGLLFCSSCSFTLMERAPRPRKPGQVPWCTATPLVPALDGAAAVAYGANSIRIMSNVSGEHKKLEGTDAAQVAAQLLLVLAHGISGVYGIISQRRCRAARAAYLEELRQTAAPEADRPVE
jgi:hypothetical protein